MENDFTIDAYFTADRARAYTHKERIIEKNEVNCPQTSRLMAGFFMMRMWFLLFLPRFISKEYGIEMHLSKQML